MENELYHHGIKGQKWGVRRYQNPDGSLTLAGKKRALSVQNKYTELSNNKKYHDKDGNLTYAGRKKALKMKEEYSSITGKSLRPFSNTSGLKSSASVKGEPIINKPKNISEMSNKEIADKIDRIRLENTLKSLTPEHISAGQKLVNGLKDAAISIAKDKGTKIVGDYIDKQLREKLGLTDKQVKSASELLKEKAQDMENKKKIAQVEDYFAKREKQKKEDSKNNQNKDSKNNQNKDSNESKESKTETWNVTGIWEEGTSKTKDAGQKWTSNRNKSNEGPIDVEWREVNDDNINSGRSYINQFLLEDKQNQFLLEDKRNN